MPIYEYKCKICGRIIELLIRSDRQQPYCTHCESPELKRLVSRPGLIRSQSISDSGELRPVNPRRAVENMSRTYDQMGVDPGQGFNEVAKRAAAGDSPQDLKEAVKEAKQTVNNSTASKSTKT